MSIAGNDRPLAKYNLCLKYIRVYVSSSVYATHIYSMLKSIDICNCVVYIFSNLKSNTIYKLFSVYM